VHEIIRFDNFHDMMIIREAKAFAVSFADNVARKASFHNQDANQNQAKIAAYLL